MRRRWLAGGAAGLVLAAGVIAWWWNLPPPEHFVGNATCAACHVDIAASHALTAHALTSTLPDEGALRGDFTAPGNVMPTGHPDLHFRMEFDGERYTQTAVQRTARGDSAERTAVIDVIIGSGRKGQTFLHWQGDELCQLPVSFWSEHEKWVNSPGYIDGRAKFDRPVTARCLECHATSVTAQPPPVNRYDPSSLVLGISCEKCHGPGGEHVRRYQSKSPPRSVEESAIINPARLARERQIDLCAWCHAGEGRSLTPPSSFRPGDDLSQHIVFARQPPNAPLDVHASQIQLLERSRCFQQSPAMTCSTCHNVHRPERNLAVMAANCMQCHQVDHCGKFATRGAAIATGCVSCHMPLQQTAQIVISDQHGGTLQPKVRNHHIAVYPEEEEERSGRREKGEGRRD
jgi:hypothetical protein